MMDTEAIIRKYCGDNPPLMEILLTHSRLVAAKALACLDAHPRLSANRTFVHEAAMLHDIGIFLTDAPGIHCHGTAHYLCHGYLGAKLLREKERLPLHARVAERHTGTGLTVAQIERRGLPLPLRDFVPETVEEQLICYADKFYSKTNLMREKPTEEVVRGLWKYGDECVRAFLAWDASFG